MNARQFQRQRRGTVLPMLACSIVVLMGFVALAIDLGMLSIAKVQAQNAADVSALTTLRTLNGNPDSAPTTEWPSQNGTYNSGNAPTAGFTAASANSIMGVAPASTQILIGSYSYNQSTQAFSAAYPTAPGGSGNTSAIISPTTNGLSAVRATVTSSNTQKTFFAGVFGVSTFQAVTATADAVFRPRDFALVMDFSGSMSLGTQMAYTSPLFNIPFSRSNNPDDVYPQFGPYATNSMRYTGSGSTATNGSDTYSIPPSNMTYVDPTNVNRAPLVLDFYSTGATVATKRRAFTSETTTDGGKTWTAPGTSDTPQLPGGWQQATPAGPGNMPPAVIMGPTTAARAYATTPGGDQWAYSYGSTTTYASTLQGILNNSTNYNANWERDGYDFIYAAHNPTNIGTTVSSYYTSNSTQGSTTTTALSGSSGVIAATHYHPDAAAYTAVAGGSITPTGAASSYTTPYSNFKGYTQGPTFWGKTFAIWPPDPRYPLTNSTTDTNRLRMMMADLGIITTSNNANGSGNAYTGSGVSTMISDAAAIITSTTPGFWANDGGATLSAYLNNKVFATNGNNGSRALGRTATPATPGASDYSFQAGSVRLTSTAGSSDGYRIYAAIMRLYNRAFMIKSPNFTFASGSGGGTPADWRRRFFNTNSNGTLYDSSGNWKAPAPNYQEIVYWLKNCGPNPFPDELHAGNITYYKSIPSNPGTNSTADEIFWKRYIDYVLVQGNDSSAQPYAGGTGYGNYFSFGTVDIDTPPSGTPGAWSQVKYMEYNNNPKRPNIQMWFGPLTMIDWFSNQPYWVDVNTNRNWLPGNCHEAPLYSAKIGVQAALTQMQSNQPNDSISLIFYSGPKRSETGTGCDNMVRAPMGLNYDYAIASLWYPQKTLNADGTNNSTYSESNASAGEIYCNIGNTSDEMMSDVPHSKFGTCFAMGLMLAYNQFITTATSDNTLRNYVTASNYPAGMAGGLGRKGAQKIVIFETDGIVNTAASASRTSVSAVGTTPAYSYYRVRYDPNNMAGSQYPGSTGSDPDYNSYAILDQLKADFGTTRKPFRLYALGFGPIYATGAADRDRGEAILEQMQSSGTPTSTATPVQMDSTQFITGTDDEMAVKLQTALTTVLQGGLQCALVK